MHLKREQLEKHCINVKVAEERMHISKSIIYIYVGNVSENKQKIWGLKNIVKMVLNDPLANALSNIWNAEKVGKMECSITPSSKIIRAVLDIMKSHKYIKNYRIDE